MWLEPLFLSIGIGLATLMCLIAAFVAPIVWKDGDYGGRAAATFFYCAAIVGVVLTIGFVGVAFRCYYHPETVEGSPEWRELNER